jgi:hypothetical protein
MRTCFVSKRRQAFTLAAEVCVTHTRTTHITHKQKYHTSHKTMTHITHTHAPSQTNNNTSPSFFFSIAIYFCWIYAEHFTPDEIERTQLQNLQINLKERGKNSGTTTAVEDTRSHVLVDTCAPAATQRSWRRDQELIHLDRGWWFLVLCTTTATFCPQGQGAKTNWTPNIRASFNFNAH